MELINKLVPIKRRIRELSPSPLSCNSDPGDLEAAASPGRQPEPDIPPIGPHNQDWLIGFCCSSAATIAVQFLQSRDPLPITFHLLCLAMACAVAALFIAKYISSKLPNHARVLEHVGVLFGVTAFIFAITLSVPLWLKLTTWTIYALSLLAIFICNRS